MCNITKEFRKFRYLTSPVCNVSRILPESSVTPVSQSSTFDLFAGCSLFVLYFTYKVNKQSNKCIAVRIETHVS